MMKKLLLTFLVVTAVGCSFKKSSDKAASAATTAAAKSRVDEVMADNRYTDRQKVEVALRKGLWDIFIKALPKVSREELNQKNKKNETLVEIAIATQRYDFLQALFDAGASPFLNPLDRYASMSYYEYRDEDAQRMIINARDRLLEKAKDICLKSDLDTMIQFLDENVIPPTLDVCGELDFFIYTFNYRKVDETAGSRLMSRYLDRNRFDYYQNMQALLFNAFIFGDEDIWRRVQAHVALGQFVFKGDYFESRMNIVPTKKMLKSYIEKRPNTSQRLRLKIQYVLKAQLKKRTGYKNAKESMSDYAELIEQAKFDADSELIPLVEIDANAPPTAEVVFKEEEDDGSKPPPPQHIDHTATSPGDPTLAELLK